MTLVKWRSGWPQWDLFDSALDKFISDVDGFRGTGIDRGNGWVPSVDIGEEENSYLIRAEVPGMGKDDINVEVKENTLTISGERKDEKEEKGLKFHRRERVYGRFERSFYLPNNVDTGKIMANFKDGVLELTIPKKEEAQAKKIQINAN